MEHSVAQAPSVATLNLNTSHGNLENHRPIVQTSHALGFRDVLEALGHDASPSRRNAHRHLAGLGVLIGFLGMACNEIETLDHDAAGLFVERFDLEQETLRRCRELGIRKLLDLARNLAHHRKALRRTIGIATKRTMRHRAYVLQKKCARKLTTRDKRLFQCVGLSLEAFGNSRQKRSDHGHGTFWNLNRTRLTANRLTNALRDFKRLGRARRWNIAR